jgi:hypothetical protein
MAILKYLILSAYGVAQMPSTGSAANRSVSFFILVVVVVVISSSSSRDSSIDK